jgi:hypothetical protein
VSPTLLDTSFWDVVGWMFIMFFAMLFIWMFIAVFADIFGRRDIGGWTKAFWIFFIFILPLFGILIYMIFRPRPSQEEVHAIMEQQYRPPATSPVDDIAKAHELLMAGAINQSEYDEIKRKAGLAPA